MSYIGKNPSLDSVEFEDSLTEAAILALPSPRKGEQRMSSDTNKMYYYDGSDWREYDSTVVSGPAAGANKYAAHLYTGSGSSVNNLVTSPALDLSSNGGLVVFASRGSAQNRFCFDSARDSWDDSLVPSLNVVEASGDALVPNVDGITIPAGGLGSSGSYNQSGIDHVGWFWEQEAGFFQVVLYTGSGSAQNIAHGLGVKPKCVVVKARDNATNWNVYLDSPSAGAGQVLQWNGGAPAASATAWDSTEPDATNFRVGANSQTNNNTTLYVAYVFGGGRCAVTEATPNPASANVQTPIAGKNINFLQSFNTGGVDVNVYDDKRDNIDAQTRLLRFDTAASESIVAPSTGIIGSNPVIIGDSFDEGRANISTARIYFSISEA